MYKWPSVGMLSLHEEGKMPKTISTRDPNRLTGGEQCLHAYRLIADLQHSLRDAMSGCSRRSAGVSRLELTFPGALCCRRRPGGARLAGGAPLRDRRRLSPRCVPAAAAQGRRRCCGGAVGSASRRAAPPRRHRRRRGSHAGSGEQHHAYHARIQLCARGPRHPGHVAHQTTPMLIPGSKAGCVSKSMNITTYSLKYDLSPLDAWHGMQLERLSARHSFGDAHGRRQHGGPSAHAKVMMWDMSAPDPDGLMLPPPISGRGAAAVYRPMA